MVKGKTFLIIAFASLIFVAYFATRNVGDRCLKNGYTATKEKILEDNDGYTYKITLNNPRGPVKEFIIDHAYKNPTFVQEHPCHLYATRVFGYNPKLGKQEYGFRGELWKYKYNSKGKKILTLYEVKKNNKFAGYFSPEYSVDHLENYLVLEKTYTDPSDNRIVFKELKNLEKDVFELSYKEIISKNPELAGYIGTGMVGWDRTGRYFWLSFFDEMRGLGVIRIDINSWNYEVFIYPNYIDGGVINVDTGWMPYDTGSIWTGDAESDEIYRQARKKEGKSSDLHIYNLFTKEDRLIESTEEDPIWFYKPEWISENELEYELPSGHHKVYNLETREYKLISTENE